MCQVCHRYIQLVHCHFISRCTHESAVADAMIGPLIYWILVASVLGYYLLTAATQYLPASQVLLEQLAETA